MSVLQIVVLVIAIVLIAFISWWFFGKHDTGAVNATMVGDHQQVEIKVNGGYYPETVVLKQGVPAQLIFNRLDKSNCLDEVVFPDQGIDEKLPAEAVKKIPFNTDQAGEYSYDCGMNMFHGKVIVK